MADRSSQVARPATAALPLLACTTAWSVAFDVHERPIVSILLLACLVGSFFWAASRLRGRRPGMSTVLGLALLLRLLCLPASLDLSDDVYRYLWDGRVALAGFNPYALTPDSTELEGLRDELWSSVAHRDVETVYPPVALAFFALASLFAQPILAWKTILVVVDLLSCWLLVRLTDSLGVDRGRSVLYCWNPLVVVEGAGMGHVDLLGVLPLLCAFALLVSRSDRGVVAPSPAPSGSTAGPSPSEARIALSAVRAAGAALFLSAAVLVKIMPVVLVPLWTLRSGASRIFGAAALGSLAVVAGGVLVLTGRVPPGFVAYGVSWEFNGPLFEPLWRLLELLRLDAVPRLVVRGLGAATGSEEPWGAIYPFLYPQLLAKVLLAGLLVFFLVRSRSSFFLSGSLSVLGVAILASATVYPWYLLWLLPFAALQRSVPWLVLSGSAFAAYLPRILGIELFPVAWLLVWAPFAVALFKHRDALSADAVLPR